ncbi:MAG: LON domain containing protein [Nitrosopumilus sp. D6]|nr:MAG: LON domain containing protein [Nitrosopumilus sp. D6]
MLQKKTLPIFPLDLVLFPRQELPLRIFEPRYKQLVDDCMLGDGQFGVCLINSNSMVAGWEAPHMVGTVVKITKCADATPDGMQLQLETIGRNPFRITEMIPPSVARPITYDPHSIEGHHAISKINEESGSGRMYLQAQVEMLPEIDGNVSILQWENLVKLWKKKIIAGAPQPIEPHALDHVLEQYYLLTETPTTDYVYSLAALGATTPQDLQPILESDTLEELVQNVGNLLG